MREREFYLPSSDGCSKLHCMEWVPEGEVRAVLQISHGMIEHIGRYREFGTYMAERGIAVLGNDHLGHGKTAADKRKLGYFSDKKGHVYPVMDIRRLTIYGRRKYPGVRLFLLGHSMGSFFVRRYLTIYEDGPDGVILLGTGGQSSLMVAAGYLLSLMVILGRGDRYRSRLIHNLSLGNYSRRFSPLKAGHDWLSRDGEKVKEYEEDEYCRFLFTAGAYRDFFRLILELDRAEKQGKIRNKGQNWKKGKSVSSDRNRLPVLFLSGSEDPVGGKEKGVEKVCRRYEKAGVEDLTLGFYRQARHELLNETNRKQVFEDIFSWMEERFL